MAYGKWRWDQSSGALSYLTGNTELRDTTLHELTGGLEATSGAAIYRPGTAAYTYFQGRGGLNVPGNEAPLVELMDNGQVIVTTGLARPPASLQTGEGAQYGIRGDVNYIDTDGLPATMRIEFSTILGRGLRGVYYVDDHGTPHVEQVRPGSPQERALIDAYPGTIRDATPQELMETALAGYIMRNEALLLDELAGGTAGLDAEQIRKQRSGMVKQLVQMWSSSISYAKQHFVFRQDTAGV